MREQEIPLPPEMAVWWMRAHLRLAHTARGAVPSWAVHVCDHSLFLLAQGADGIRGLKGTKGEKVRICPLRVGWLSLLQDPVGLPLNVEGN